MNSGKAALSAACSPSIETELSITNRKSTLLQPSLPVVGLPPLESTGPVVSGGPVVASVVVVVVVVVVVPVVGSAVVGSAVVPVLSPPLVPEVDEVPVSVAAVRAVVIGAEEAEAEVAR